MMNTTCYRLVVCEKPSVARSIAAVLGAGRREDGFLSGGGYLVSCTARTRKMRITSLKMKTLLTVRRTKTNDEYDLLPACCV